MLKSMLRPDNHDWVESNNPEKRYLYTADMGAALFIFLMLLGIASMCVLYIVLARGNAEKISMIAVYALVATVCIMLLLFQIRLRYEFNRKEDTFSAFYKFPAWTWADKLSWLGFRVRKEANLPLSALSAVYVMTQTIVITQRKRDIIQMAAKQPRERVVFQLRMGSRELAALNSRKTIVNESVYICYKSKKADALALAHEISICTGAQVIEIYLEEDEREKELDFMVQS